MALVQPLPNGHLVILLTPREASLLSDQILEPNDFPWTGSESQVVAFEVKQRIKSALETQLVQEVHVIAAVVIDKMREEPTDEPEPEPTTEDGDEDGEGDEEEAVV